MKGLGYGEGYRYDPSEEGGVAAQTYLPPALDGERFYEPGTTGFEPTLRERMAWWEEKRREVRAAGEPGEGQRGSGEG